MTAAGFEALLAEGMALDVEAYWGAGFLAGRYVPGEVSWRWPEVVRPYLEEATRLLDMGTGEGRVLLSLAPLPPFSVAYEAWWPTVSAAAETLLPNGVQVVVCLGSDDNTMPSGAGRSLPFADRAFDIVTNRHEAFDPQDVRRLLRARGTFVSQQVGSDEEDSVRALLGLSAQGSSWSLDRACSQVELAGLAVEQSAEERVVSRFRDIAAMVGYLRSTPWAVPEFDLVAMRRRLELLHDRCSRTGSIDAVGHRFWLAARASSSA